jgi:hypothetical protein
MAEHTAAHRARALPVLLEEAANIPATPVKATA